MQRICHATRLLQGHITFPTWERSYQLIAKVVLSLPTWAKFYQDVVEVILVTQSKRCQITENPVFRAPCERSVPTRLVTEMLSWPHGRKEVGFGPHDRNVTPCYKGNVNSRTWDERFRRDSREMLFWTHRIYILFVLRKKYDF